MPPTVSIIVPCFNEQKHILFLLDAIFAQTYPRNLLDVTIADGLSTDGTHRAIAAFQQDHPDLRLQVVHNPLRTIPAALNLAIATSSGEIILRLDAHSGPHTEYIARSVAALEAGKGENVGGVWEIEPGARTRMAAAIAVAAAHPLGVGDALYRHTTQAAQVDTVPFGAYRRSLIGKIGTYDQSLLANEDYEFNTRIRLAGGIVWLDPAIRSVYFARSDLAALAKQYFRYGFWKLKMLQRYPGTLRWRQALPPTFLISLLAACLLSLFYPVFIWLIGFELLCYFGALALAGLQAALKRHEYFLILGLPLAIAVMHLAWGSGFISSIFLKSGIEN